MSGEMAEVALPDTDTQAIGPARWIDENRALRAENERLREALTTARDYIADAAAGALTYEGSGEGFVLMAKEDLARIDAALSEQEGK